MIREFSILWGPGLINRIDFSYPVVGDSPRTWRSLREGSERLEAGASVDVSVTGQDYYLAVTAKWFDLEHATDPTGLQAFITWANNGHVFTLVPDIDLPGLTVPGCMLVQPFADPSWSVEGGGEMTVDLLIRHPTIDLNVAWRGLFFEYKAGQSLTDRDATFLRPSTGYEIGPSGYLVSRTSNDPTDGHYQDRDLQTLLLTDTVVNDVTNPEALDNASWTKNECTITANDAIAPDGAKTADLIVESVTASAIHTCTSAAITIAADDTWTALCFVRNGGRGQGIFWMNDAATGAGGNRAGVAFNLFTGTITGNQVLGTATLVASKIVPLAGGWFMLWIRGTLGGAITTAYLTLRLGDNAGNFTYTGDGASGMYFWGATAVHPASKCVTTYAARSRDELTFPLGQTGMHTPQAMWFYVKFVEGGTAVIAEGDGRRLFFLGTSTPGYWVQNIGGIYRSTHHNGSTQIGNGNGTLTAPAFGDVVEILSTINADGSVNMRQSINGGAETSGTVSAANALATQWGFAGGYPKLHFNMQDPAAKVGYNAFAVVKSGPLVASGPRAVTTVAIARTV